MKAKLDFIDNNNLKEEFEKPLKMDSFKIPQPAKTIKIKKNKSQFEDSNTLKQNHKAKLRLNPQN